METNLREIKILIPNDILLSINMNEELLIHEILRNFAFNLFAEGRLSSGKAAKLAGMTKIVFLIEAGKREIDILPYSPDELKRELA
jgi:predicted HTH domain antitoxin